MRTTCWLVKRYTPPYIEPIREGVRKICLMCKFVKLHFQSFVMIGWTSEQFMIWTNQKWCSKASSAQGVNVWITTAWMRAFRNMLLMDFRFAGIKQLRWIQWQPDDAAANARTKWFHDVKQLQSILWKPSTGTRWHDATYGRTTARIYATTKTYGCYCKVGIQVNFFSFSLSYLQILFSSLLFVILFLSPFLNLCFHSFFSLFFVLCLFPIFFFLMIIVFHLSSFFSSSFFP